MFLKKNSKKQIKYFVLSENAIYFIKNYAAQVIELHLPIDEATLKPS